MRSIEFLFRQVAKTAPDYGSYPCLAHSVRGHGFSRESLRIAFRKFVNKDDYDPKEKKQLLDHLEDLTQTPRGRENRG